jgi:hypothetical protein
MVKVDLKQARTITGIDFDADKIICPSMLEPTGCLVRIRPCAEKYNNKTYLGLLIGEIQIPCSLDYSENRLVVHHFKNPAIYVFELKEVILGLESWWSVIPDSDIEKIKEIGDEEINNSVVIRLIKMLAEGKP